MKMKEILSLVTTWTDLEGSMQSKINQKEKKNTVWYQSQVESNKINK